MIARFHACQQWHAELKPWRLDTNPWLSINNLLEAILWRYYQQGAQVNVQKSRHACLMYSHMSILWRLVQCCSKWREDWMHVWPSLRLHLVASERQFSNQNKRNYRVLMQLVGQAQACSGRTTRRSAASLPTLSRTLKGAPNNPSILWADNQPCKQIKYNYLQGEGPNPKCRQRSQLSRP